MLGGVTAKKRDAQMVSLLDNSFARLGVTQYAEANSRKIAAAPRSPAELKSQLAALDTQADDDEEGKAARQRRAPQSNANSGVQKVNYSKSAERAWAIQMGRYRRQRDLVNAVEHAKDVAGDHLEATQVTFSKTGHRRNPHHTAKLANLTESEARSACSAMHSARETCRVVRVN